MGEILWDVLPTGKVLGGAPANFAYHANRYGFEGRVVSAIGRDGLGEEILETLKAKKLESLIEFSDHPTGTVMVELDGTGLPTYTITEDVAWDYIGFTPEMEALARRSDAVCFGTLAQRSRLSRETFLRFFDTMPSGGLKVFDINLRQHFYSEPIIVRSLEVADILKINDEELAVVSPMLGLVGDEVARCGELMRRYELGVVILTKGAAGSVIVSGEGISEVATPVVKVVDTVGAGDAFTAAFVTSYLAGEGITAAHENAVELSAFVCTRSGAMPERDREQITNE